MRSPSRSATGSETRSAPTKVPFLLPQSSTVAPSSLTRTSACRRDTLEWSTQMVASWVRPSRLSPGWSAISLTPQMRRYS